MQKLSDKVKSILNREFRDVHGIRTLYIERDGAFKLNLYAQVRTGIDPDALTQSAFDAFTRVADRLALEANGTHLTWYGLVQDARPGAEEVSL